MKRIYVLLFITLLCILSACSENHNVYLKDIRIIQQINDKDYEEKEELNLDGLKVEAIYSDDSTKIITDYTLSIKGPLLTSDKLVVISYTEESITKSVSFGINVSKTDKINAPVIKIDGNNISWEKVEKADKYEIYYNGEYFTNTENNEYEINSNELIKVTVKAVITSHNLKSENSNEIIYLLEKLNAPVIKLSDNTVSWEKVNGADSYNVYINEEKVINTKELSYTLENVTCGNYDIKVSAVSQDESKKSNTVRYVIYQELDEPIVLIANDNAAIIKDNFFSLSTSQADFLTTSYILENAYDNVYFIRLQNGKYLKYITSIEAGEENGSVVEEVFDEKDEAFMFIFERVESSYNEYKISNLKAQKEINSVNTYMTATSKVSFVNVLINDSLSNVWQVIKTKASDFKEVLLKEEFDLSKPVVASCKEKENYIYTSFTGNVEGLESFLTASKVYSKYFDQTLYYDDAWIFEEYDYKPKLGSQVDTLKYSNIEDGKYYLIRNKDGKYLSMVFGDHLNMQSYWYSAFDYLDEENVFFVWQLIKTENDNTFMMKNLGVNIAYGEKNKWACKNSDDRLHIYPMIEGHEAFEFVFNNIDFSQKEDVKKIDLSGNYNIANLYKNAYYKYDINYTTSTSGNLEVAHIRKGESINALSLGNEYLFTIEKVEDTDFINANLDIINNCYRIKNYKGEYLSFNHHGDLEGRSINHDLSSIYGTCQIFIITKVPGIINSYRIANLYLGKWEDSRDGISRYIVFQSHNEIDEAIWNRQNFIEYQYHLNAIWMIKEVK